MPPVPSRPRACLRSRCRQRPRKRPRSNSPRPARPHPQTARRPHRHRDQLFPPQPQGPRVVGKSIPTARSGARGPTARPGSRFSTPVKLQGSEVAAGTYELFTIPGPDEWTIILQKAASQWGAYQYKEDNDVLRVKAAPVALANPVETFTIDINDIRDESATLDLIWANWRVPVKLEVDVVGNHRAADQGRHGLGRRQEALRAGRHVLPRPRPRPEARPLAWIDAAIAEQPNAFYLFYHKARILAKMGDKAGALATARQSIELAAKADTVRRRTNTPA